MTTISQSIFFAVMGYIILRSFESAIRTTQEMLKPKIKELKKKLKTNFCRHCGKKL